MDTRDNPSLVEDLRGKAIDELSGSDDAVNEAIGRILPDDGFRVPVAAFNSMI